ncbi:MAG: NAD(+) synthase, partial [Actinobacteria bacterium]|nr:NAD(+) synthase [Actinomycetota bacterium]
VRHDLLARMRGAMLQAISDELGHLALATGNKTELSIGSAALYGDMAGGYAPLKDCPKTLLYALARHRNRHAPAIPEEILEKTPSALLGEEAALPPYEELDPIVERYVEKGEGLPEIVAAGFDPVVVRGVLQLVDNAEPQRRLIPPGVKISRRAFGKDRRMPITNAWRPFRDEEAKLAPGAEPAPAQSA